jgi:hypothetical protein
VPRPLVDCQRFASFVTIEMTNTGSCRYGKSQLIAKPIKAIDKIRIEVLDAESKAMRGPVSFQQIENK